MNTAEPGQDDSPTNAAGGGSNSSQGAASTSPASNAAGNGEFEIDDELLAQFSRSVAEGLQGFDVAKYSQATSVQPASESQQSTQILEHVEEIANDMLAVMRRIREVEEAQQRLIARLEQVNESSSQWSHAIAREVDTLRRDVLGDRKNSALGDVFGELMPAIDRLHTMKCNLNTSTDNRMIAQLDGVLETLSSCLRRLGCEEFRVAVGSDFDAEQMECIEYLPTGAPNVVLWTADPGYRCGGLVLRRAAVKIADPRALASPGVNS
jgi:molecular chaperone GrpE (heat shock protein)